MKNKLYQNLESIGTVLWLITDFIWMCGFIKTAAILAIPTFLLLTTACIECKKAKMSELLSMTASVMWFVMNMCWIFSDITAKEDYMLCAKFSFLFACIFVYLSFRAAKKENGPIDFKRLKLK